MDAVVAAYAGGDHEGAPVVTTDRAGTNAWLADQHDSGAVVGPGESDAVERILVHFRGAVPVGSSPATW